MKWHNNIVIVSLVSTKTKIEGAGVEKAFAVLVRCMIQTEKDGKHSIENQHKGLLHSFRSVASASSVVFRRFRIQNILNRSVATRVKNSLKFLFYELDILL